MDRSKSIPELNFPELWEIFLTWRIAILEWPLSPKVVFDEVDPIADLEFGQFLTDERHLIIDRLLQNPDTEIRLAFTKVYRDFIDALNNGDTNPDWWEGMLATWLKPFLMYAVTTVPPNYRRKQVLLFAYEGLEPMRGCPPAQGQRPN